MDMPRCCCCVLLSEGMIREVVARQKDEQTAEARSQTLT